MQQTMKDIVNKLRDSKVLENYSYMTLLQLFSALIGFVIYPIVIRRVGVEQYGLYAFILSVVLYFQIVIDFGFDFPAVKAVSLYRDDNKHLSEIVSAIFCAKSLLFVAMTLVAVPVVMLVPMLRSHWMLFAVLFLQNAVSIILPQWYFQGMKQMKVPTLINVSFRVLQIPFILWLVKGEEDIIWYAVIITASMLLGAVVALGIMLKDGIQFRLVGIQRMMPYFKDGWAFFLTDLAGSLKERVLTNIIGVYLGMREVAIYDLATKVVSIPRMFTQSINKALFPEVVTKANASLVNKILRYERRIGLTMILGVVALGYWVIWIMGGREMLSAYPAAVILSGSIYAWLIVGAYLQFVFIPSGHYMLVTWNQVVALVSCLLMASVGLWLFPSVLVIVSAIMLSGFAEIAFCRVMCKKKQLL